MRTVDVFYQRGGVLEIEHLEIGEGATLAELKHCLVAKHGLHGELALFLENDDDEAAEHRHVGHYAGHAGLKVHVGHRRRIDVKVTFNGNTIEHAFSPAATIDQVKAWAAEKKFGIADVDAGELVLQLIGRDDQPPANTHIGSLVPDDCRELRLNLVPKRRING